MGLKEDLFKAIDEAKFVPYEVNGIKCTLRVMNGVDRDIWEQYIVNNDETKDNARALLCSLFLGDENGNKIFSKHDIAELGKRDYRILDKIIEDGSKLNEIQQDSIRGLEKN